MKRPIAASTSPPGRASCKSSSDKVFGGEGPHNDICYSYGWLGSTKDSLSGCEKHPQRTALGPVTPVHRIPWALFVVVADIEAMVFGTSMRRTCGQRCARLEDPTDRHESHRQAHRNGR
jgi:hypothetical protein